VLLTDERVEELLSAFARVRLLVVGDAFLDEYLYGDALRLSPEAPVPVVQIDDAWKVLGGAGNVVRNIVALGGDCEFVGVVGDDETGDAVVSRLSDLGIDTQGTVRVAGRPTTHKTRLVARRQQIVRFDRETRAFLAAPDAERVLTRVAEALGRVAAVVIEDYAKGLLSVEVGRAVMRAAAEAGRPVNVDPKESLEPFPGASLVKPNLAEAAALSGLRVHEVGLEAIGRRLQKLVGGGDVAITQGGSGITIFEGPRPGLYVPTARQEVFDVQGAGDTIIAALSLARQAGASLLEATVIANAAAFVVVGKTGTATADRDEIRASLPAVRAAAVQEEAH
jgi:D-beta-D-heptose 7-phosphate kinase/D-beta-D-heptose 1-phosphate adenosyltransferase